MMYRRPGGDIEYTPFKAGAFIPQRATAYELPERLDNHDIADSEPILGIAASTHTPSTTRQPP